MTATLDAWTLVSVESRMHVQQAKGSRAPGVLLGKDLEDP
jgi:hypothetical protein